MRTDEMLKVEELHAENARLRAALKDALDVMTINQKVRSPEWGGEATEESAIGRARAALGLEAILP